MAEQSYVDNSAMPRRAWLGWAAAAAALAFVAVESGRRIAIRYVYDFTLYLAASENAQRSGWDHLYSIPGQVHEMLRLIPWLRSVETPFWSTPPVAFLVTPLTYLPLQWAQSIWTALMLAALASGILAAARLAPRLPAWAPLLVVASFPLSFGIWLGQVSSLVTGLVGLGLWLLARRQAIPAGAAFGVALILKPQLVLLGAVALIWAAPSAAAVCAGVAVAAAAGSLLVIGPAAGRQYLAELLAASGAAQDNTTWAGYVGAVAPALQVASALLALAASLLRRRSPEVSVALAVIGTIGAAQYLHIYDFAVLVPAGLVVAGALPLRSERLWAFAGAVTMLLGIGLPLLIWAMSGPVLAMALPRGEPRTELG